MAQMFDPNGAEYWSRILILTGQRVFGWLEQQPQIHPPPLTNLCYTAPNVVYMTTSMDYVTIISRTTKLAVYICDQKIYSLWMDYQVQTLRVAAQALVQGATMIPKSYWKFAAVQMLMARF